MVGGHYDTKPYSNMKFVGANDGGSSTAAMLELARVLNQIRKSEAGKMLTVADSWIVRWDWPSLMVKSDFGRLE